MTVEDKIKEIIEKLRPFLINDGGDLQFVKYENNIVYVKFSGACADCGLIDITLKEGVEAAIMAEINEVKEVVSI